MASQTSVVVVDGPDASLPRAEERLRSLERSWSRFRAESDISRLNATPDTWLRVADATITLVDKMQRAVELTEGRYDPTYLHELICAGYDRSIDDPNLVSVAVDLPCVDHRVSDVRVDLTSRSVLLPRGMGLDPGGIGKGLAGDLVVAELLRLGARGALVSIGGDIAAGGSAPGHVGWTVDVVHDPVLDAPLARLAVNAGGIATSSTRTRRWVRDGVVRHHTIDPATGTISDTDLAAVTVVAARGWLAEVHATAALLCGSSGVIAYLDAVGASGVASTLDGELLATEDLLAVASTPTGSAVVA